MIDFYSIRTIREKGGGMTAQRHELLILDGEMTSIAGEPPLPLDGEMTSIDEVFERRRAQAGSDDA